MRAALRERVARHLLQAARLLMDEQRFIDAATLLETCNEIESQATIIRECLARCYRELALPADSKPIVHRELVMSGTGHTPLSRRGRL
jgi:hypothetical protein